jgi:succinoglycan biosynthesis transport protein ExoP
MARSDASQPTKKNPAPVPLTGASVDWRQLVIVLRTHFWVAAALTLIVCSFVAWWQLSQPKRYAASASLYFERGSRLEEMRNLSDAPMNEVQLFTRLEQLRSVELAQRVAESLKPEELALVLGTEASLTPAAPEASSRRGNVAAFLRSSVTAQRRPETMLLTVSTVHTNPAAAALIANRYAETFIRYVFERSMAGNDAALGFLREQAEEMRKKVETAERELQDYRQRFHLVSLEANQNIIVDNLKTLNASATEARVTRLAVEARFNQAEDLLKRDADAEQLASVTEFESLSDLAKRLAELQAKRAVMAERYGRRHPAMQDSGREIEALKKLRDERVQSAIASLRDQVEKARVVEKQLIAQLAEAEKEALQLDQVGVEYNTLRRAAETNRQTYSQILARLNEATMSAQLSGVNIKISENARPPVAPFSPNPRRTLLLTLALGLAIFLGYPFTMELFFGRVRSVADVEHFLDVDVLGEIGSVRSRNDSELAQLVRHETDEAATEQFRALYSQFVLSSRIDPPKTLLVTSTLPGEGKSFIAANLAQLFVAHGRRVLLIDGDLRRPVQHRNFSLPNNAGILAWLSQQRPVGPEVLQDPLLGLHEVAPKLHLLRTGGSSRKATELLSAEALPRLIEELQRHYDVLIIDTPPAGVFPDAVAFAKFCHEVVFVCRFNTVTRQAVRSVLARFRQAQIETPGVVLNAMPTGFGGATYYYGYGYHQAKRYGKAYSAKPDPKS